MQVQESAPAAVVVAMGNARSICPVRTSQMMIALSPGSKLQVMTYVSHGENSTTWADSWIDRAGAEQI